jgi:hypothetical protein
MTPQEKAMKDIALITILSDKIESLICDFKPLKNSIDNDMSMELLSLQNWILSGQNRYKRVRKNLMDKLELQEDDIGDVADFINAKLDDIFNEHITVK